MSDNKPGLDPKLIAAAKAYLNGDKGQWDMVETKTYEVGEAGAGTILRAITNDPEAEAMVPLAGICGLAVLLGRVTASALADIEHRPPSAEAMAVLVSQMYAYGQRARMAEFGDE